MTIIMGKGCIEAIYGLMGWKGLKTVSLVFPELGGYKVNINTHSPLSDKTIVKAV